MIRKFLNKGTSGNFIYSQTSSDIVYDLEDPSKSVYQILKEMPKTHSPALTGTPTAPTVSPEDSSASIATTEYVKNNLKNYSLSNHTHSPSSINNGAINTGVTASTGTDYNVSRLRNAMFATQLPTTVSNGSIVFIYE